MTRVTAIFTIIAMCFTHYMVYHIGKIDGEMKVRTEQQRKDFIKDCAATKRSNDECNLLYLESKKE